MKIKNFDKTPSGFFQEIIKQDPIVINNGFSIVQYSLFSIIKELAINDVKIKSVIPKEHTLEEIFFDATNKKGK